MSSSPDPVVARRAQIARWVKVGKRIGYGALLLAMVAFAIAFATDFPDWLVGISVGGLLVGVTVLPVPIVVGYGIRAAERDERRDQADRQRGSSS